MTERIAVDVDLAIYDLIPVVRKILKRELPGIFVGPGTPFDKTERPDRQMAQWAIPTTVSNAVISDNVYEVFNAGGFVAGTKQALMTLIDDPACEIDFYSTAWTNGNDLAFKRSQSAKRNWFSGHVSSRTFLALSPYGGDSLPAARIRSGDAIIAAAQNLETAATLAEAEKIRANVLATA